MAKKIALISLSTPTFNNVRAASALPYHLMLGAREGGCEFRVWTFNINGIAASGVAESAAALGAEITLLPRPRWQQWLFRLRLTPLRALLRYPLMAYYRLSDKARAEIQAWGPDTVWIYGEELAPLARLFPGKRRVVTMPDSEAMYYHRALATEFLTQSLTQVMRYAIAYHQYRGLERHSFQAIAGENTGGNAGEDVTFHFVGDADARFFRGINAGARAVFLRHPHYACRPRQIHFHTPRIRLLFAGRYDIYSSHGSDALLTAMEADKSLAASFELTFLGKGWETWQQRLAKAGWHATHVAFAPDYISALQQHDIQVNAIDLGTGTKGKVLDAMANGLLAFGTSYALENIAASPGHGCVLYDTPAQAIATLRDIAASPARYEQMAEQGRQAVLAAHDRKEIARQLFA